MSVINKENSPYFYKSKYLYRLTWYTLLWVCLYTQLAKALNINFLINAVLTVFPALGFCMMVVIGTSYIVKSYSNKEPYNKYRAFYLFGFLFFSFLIIAFVVAIIGDISRFKGKG
jgi:hypothetical protein